MRRKRLVVGFLAASCLGGVMVEWWPQPRLDLSNDEEPFRSMAMPPKSVIGTGYMDGGSVAVIVTDRDGNRHELTFPIEVGSILNPYPFAYSGNINDRRAAPLRSPARAKAIAIRLLRDFGARNTPRGVDAGYDGTRMAVRALSNSPASKMARLVDRGWKSFR